VWEHAGQICRPEWTTKLRNATGLFCYAVVRPDRLPGGFVDDLSGWAAERGWRIREAGVLGADRGCRRHLVDTHARQVRSQGRGDEPVDLDQGTELVVPADLPDAVSDEVREMACRAFDALSCEGLARVDFFVSGDRVIINEVNTMPGFTPVSMFPLMWKATGIDYPALVDRLVQTALRRPSGLH